MKKVSLFASVCIAAALAVTIGHAQSYQWGSVAIGGGGFVSAVVAHPTAQNLFYARTDVGGAYRWENATQSWTPLTDWVSDNEVGFLGVEAVAVDPNNANKVYLMLGIDYFNSGKTAIARSSDRGNTFSVAEVTGQFKAHGNGMGRQNGERLAVDPNKGNILFVGTRRNGLFKSADSGATWTSVASFPVTTTNNDNGVSFVLFDPTTGSNGNATQTIYVGVSRMGSTNLYVSINGGTSWAAVPNAITTHMPQRAKLAGGKLFVTYGNGAGPHGHWSITEEAMSTGSIRAYNTAGSSWTTITPTGFTCAFSGIDVDPANSNHLIATTINLYQTQPWGWGDRIFVSSDGGASWNDIFGANRGTMDANGFPWITNHAVHWAGTVVFDPFNASRVFVTSGNGIFMTSNLAANGTSTWKFMVKGLEEVVPLDAVSIPGGALVSVIGDYDGFRHADPAVVPSTSHTPGVGTTTGVAYAALDITKVVRAGDKLYRSTDGAATWTEVTRPNTNTRGTVSLNANGTTLLWTATSSTSTMRTTNNGGSWTTVNGLSFEARTTADMMNANKFYAYNPSTGYMMVSTDAGANFTQGGSAGTGGSKIIRARPGTEGEVWVPLNGNGLTRTVNSGTSFAKITSVTYCGAVGFGKSATTGGSPAVYIWGKANGASANGLYRSDDLGTSWVRINDDAHEFGGPGNGQFVFGDMNVYGRVYMSTAGRGIAYGNYVAGTSSSSVVSSSSVTPSSSSTISSSSSAPVAAFVVQGESFCSADGVLESSNLGFVGSGYLNFNNGVGAKATWAVQALVAGNVQVTARYANGSTGGLPVQILVDNSQVIASQSFPVTGAWTTYVEQTFSFAWTAGVHELKLVSTTANGGPNLDQLSFSVGIPATCNDIVSLRTIPRRQPSVFLPETRGWDLLGRPITAVQPVR